MNLNSQTAGTARNPLFLGSIFFCLLVSSSCQDNPGEYSLGREFLESQTAVFLIDTFAVSLSTVIFDTVSTSGTGNVLIGSYRDNVFGRMRSDSYFQIGIPGSPDVQEDDHYDSLILMIRYNGYYFGDTSKSQRIVAYRLTENIEFDYGNVITSHTNFDYDPTPIGSLVYAPTPGNAADTLSIRISDALGQDLFRKLVLKSEELSNSDLFRTYFRGVALKADDAHEGAIVGFRANEDDLKLILFTRRRATLEENPILFRLWDSQRQFNTIAHDFGATRLQPLVEQRTKLPSSSTGGLSFLHGGIGVAIRVDFPSLQEALLIKKAAILAATLSIFPAKNEYDKVELPPDLIIQEADGLNRPGGTVASSTLDVDKLYGEETAYSFDITKYLLDELSDFYVDPEKGLLITLPSSIWNTKLHRLIAQTESKNTKLRMYYLSY